MKTYNAIVDTYLFEAVERITRFYNHLDSVKDQFYKTSKSEDKLIFIDEYKDYLIKLLEIISKLSKISDLSLKEKEVSSIIKSIQGVIKMLAELHINGLNYLPRPSEPVELERFKRIIDKNHLNRSGDLKEKQIKRISFFPTEDIGETTYRKTALLKFEPDINEEIKRYNKQMSDSDTIGKMFSSKNVLKEVTELNLLKSRTDSIHITIPRIDSENPCRWPTLIHEIAHHISQDGFFKTRMLEDFKENAARFGNTYINKVFPNDKKLDNWLLECWCDIFASFVIGPAFWFSQYSAFLFAESKYPINSFDSDEYPPAFLRLKLIYSILQHRGKLLSNPMLHAVVEQYSHLFNWLANDYVSTHDSIIKRHDVDAVYLVFKHFFLDVFYKNESTEYSNLNQVVKSYIKESTEINFQILPSLVEDLNNGLPICSVVRSNESSFPVESPTTLQEILLAAWLYREQHFRKRILDLFKTAPDVNDDSNKTQFISFYEDKTIKQFSRFDQSVLRSIQVSEWFQLFHRREDNSGAYKSAIHEATKSYGGVLVDHEIKYLIETKEMRIIPIMHFDKQLGSSSLDIRLGTSFQIFHPTGTGSVDFTNEESTNTFESNSQFKDLDYLESITIQPGQFVLGHTMEYIKLPNTIAAEIEGRSSFARMGLEIHMTAGYIDPGFEGVITLEIFNAGAMPICLYPGMRIGQIRFLHVNIPDKPYNVRHDAKYKGLLMHNYTLQNKDIEIACIKEEKQKYNHDYKLS